MRKSTCTVETGCDYPMTVGLIPGVDVSIDGDIWPGSPFDEHRKTCPANGWEETHWVSDAPTSLHGNGASSFAFTTRERSQVTCKLCLTLLARQDVELNQEPS